MPRQIKKSLSYFTLDCDIFSKTADLRPLLRKFKADGLAVYVHILCDVYSTGYYFKPDDPEGYILDLAEDCGISEEKVKLILAFMQGRTLLDAFSLDKNTVYTSHGIQKRYAEAMKGRKRTVAEIKGEYWLLTEEEEKEIDTFYKTRPFANKSEKNADKSEKMDDKSERNSLTEQKGNSTTYVVAGLTADDYAELCEKIGKADTDYYIERVKAFREKNPQATFSVKATILKWHREDAASDKGKRSLAADTLRAPRVVTDASADELNAAFAKLNEDL